MIAEYITLPDFTHYNILIYCALNTYRKENVCDFKTLFQLPQNFCIRKCFILLFQSLDITWLC